MVTLPMMSGKTATLGLLEINVIWSKGCDVIISVNDVTNKIYHVIQSILWICSRDQSLVTLAFLS